MEKFKNIISWLFGSRKRVVVIIIVLLGVIFLVARQNSSKSQTVTQTGEVTRGTLVVSLSASGQVTALNSAVVNTSATGVVSKVFVKNGQKVKSGDPIIQLELDQDSKQKYMSALASYNSAKNSLASSENSVNTLQASMFAANVKFINDAVARNLSVTDPTYIQENANWLASENAYNNQQNAISAARQSLSASGFSLRSSSPIVYAPIAGTINGLSLTMGSVIASQSSTTNAASAQRIASVVTDANPTVTLNLTQIDAPKIKIGELATVTLDAFPSKSYTGKVVSVDAVGTLSAGVTNYPTVIQLDTRNPEMFPNMSATANIILDTRDSVLLVPSTAIQTANGQSTVRVMKNGVMQTVDVTIGESDETDTEIVTGLNERDIVVTSVITSSAASTRANTTSVFSGFGGARGGGFGGGARVGGGAGR